MGKKRRGRRTEETVGNRRKVREREKRQVVGRRREKGMRGGKREYWGREGGKEEEQVKERK